MNSIMMMLIYHIDDFSANSKLKIQAELFIFEMENIGQTMQEHSSH